MPPKKTGKPPAPAPSKQPVSSSSNAPDAEHHNASRVPTREEVEDDERLRDVEAVQIITAEDIVVHPPIDYLDGEEHAEGKKETYIEDSDDERARGGKEVEASEEKEVEEVPDAVQQQEPQQPGREASAQRDGDDEQHPPQSSQKGQQHAPVSRSESPSPSTTTPRRAPPTGAGVNLSASGVMDTRNRFGGRLSVTNSSSEMKPITAGAGSPYVNAPDNHDARGPSAEPFGTTSSDGGGSSTGDEEDELFDENGMLKPLPIGGPIFSILALCALVLFAVGASLPWMSRRLPDISYFFTLWKFTTKSPEGFPVDNWVIDMACMQMKARLRVLEVFAVLTIGFTAMAVPIGIASSRQRKPLLPGIIVIGMAAIFALATWAMSIALYFKSNMCPNDVDTNPLSFSAQKFDFDAGFGLYVTGNVLLLLAMAVGILQPVVPPSIRRSAVVRLMTIIAAVVHIVCALFVIVGTAPVQWFYKWDSDLATVHRITLWSNRTSTNGHEINNDRLVDSQCGEISALARFGQAFACAAIPVTILGAILSVLSSDLLTPGGVGSRFIGLRGCIFAMMGTVVTTVCPLVAGLSLYYRQFCAIPSLQGDQYHMTGGLVLFGCATALSAFGLIVLLTVAIVQIVAKPNSAEASLGNTRWTAFLFLVCVGICVLFQAIAANSYLFGKTRDDFNWEQWSFWRVYHRQSAISYNTAFSCPDQRRRLIGAGTLNIIGLVVNAAAFLLGIAQLSSRFLRKAASMVGMSGCLLLLVSWSLVVDVYRTGYCGQASFASQGFKLIEGFGLQIVGWGIAVMACVLNYLLVPFKVNRP